MISTRPLAALLALAVVLQSVPAAAQRVVAPVVAPRVVVVVPGLSLRAPLSSPAGLPSLSVLPTVSPSLPAVRAAVVAAPAAAVAVSAAVPAVALAKPAVAAKAQAAAPQTSADTLRAVTAQLAETKRSNSSGTAPLLNRFFDAGAVRGSVADAVTGRAAAWFGPGLQARSGVTDAPAAKAVPVPGERKLAMLGMLWSFLAISSMYIVMPVRSAFLLTQHGPDVLPWVFMASAAFTGAAAWVYGRFSDRPRAQLIGGTLAVLATGLVGWWAAAPLAMASAPTAFAFSMWTDAFTIMSATLFWTYAADRFKGESVKRWFGFFAAAGALGSIVGSGLTRYMVAALGAPAMLLIAAVVFAAIGLVFWAMERIPELAAASAKPAPPATEGGAGAWATAKTIAASPYLLALAVLVFLERLVPDFMQYLFNLQAQQVYTTKESMAAFMAGFGIIAGVLSLVAGAALTRWMLTRLGVGKTLLSAPLMSILGFAAMGVAPTLPVTVGANLAEGLPRYTVFKAAKEATYTTADKDVLYRVKAYIEMFVYRFARGIAGLLLLFLTGPAFLAWGPAAVAWAAVPFGLVWVWAAWRVGREYRKAEAAKERTE
ncbi:MAG: MFS transporter [Elusimicrobia bacterium]|nr:MFS transporter [Elusimicrobiota bacterium]